MKIMTIVIEVLKYTIPGLVVFAAVYFILRQYLNSQYQMKALEMKARYTKQAIPLKLQAYERLLLFCERISIPNLLLRLKSNDMSAVDLKNALVISVQKEFEHNMAQQLYCSNKLWDIIALAKNDVISIISDISGTVSAQAPASDLSTALMKRLANIKKSPIDVARAAIKEEAKIILNV